MIGTTLPRVAMLGLALASLSSAAGAAVESRALAGPLGKSLSGRMLCKASPRLGATGSIVLTLFEENGAVAKTETFPGVRFLDVVSIQVATFGASRYVCLAESSIPQGVELTLSHVNSLGQSTATVGEPRGVPPRSAQSVAGPLSPGLSRRVVCEGTAEIAAALDLVITNEDGAGVAMATRAVSAMGSAEISAPAAYDERYVCTVSCGDPVGTRVQATIESRDTLGTPLDADEGSPEAVPDGGL